MPRPRGSGSCPGTGYAAANQEQKMDYLCLANNLENDQIHTPARTCAHTASECGPYRSTLVLLRSIVHGFVPCHCTVAADFVHVQFPKPKKIKTSSQGLKDRYLGDELLLIPDTNSTTGYR